MVSLFLILNFKTASSQSVTDTLHIQHYIIHIDSIGFAQQSIRAHANVKVVSKLNNVQNISLSLLKLTIDSIYYPGGNLSYTYNDTVIHISPPAPLNQNDTFDLTVVYHGNPQQDASGWGGFYFSANAAFNLGVGFDSDPHNLGKVWFPCLDVFTDKCTYDFFITTPSNLKAYCNGYLNSTINNPNGTIIWNWKMDAPIPTYLACMSVANYTSWIRTVAGIPVEIAALPSDTPYVTSTFVNLPVAVNTFVDFYGAYPFNKIGYSLVNFGSGAMEHATNISIGKAFINGTLSYETLWAHELSHMWWGDKVTCKTAEDMWLNEGWASYNEALFTQALYGETAYKNWIRTNHRKVLQFAHITDGSYYAMNAIPPAYTYGFHVYQKGADIVHTLRNYLGDASFKHGAQAYLNKFAYGNAASADMRDVLTDSTGTNMTDFFDDWIFTPGFPHFSIDSVVYFPGGLDHYFVYTRQRSKGNAGHIYHTPVELTFSNGFMDTTVTVIIDSATNMFHIPLLIGNAQWVAVDRNEKISDAISDYERTVTATGTFIMQETNTTLLVQTVGSPTSKVRVEHNWVQPDGFKQSNPGIRISDYHYWKVDGIFETGFYAKMLFQYNGSTSTTNGYIDNTLITGVEDSLVILYRANTADDWHTVAATQNMGSPVDKVGNFTVDTLFKGEYVLGYRDQTVNVANPPKIYPSLKASPNPADGLCTISFSLPPGEKGDINVYSTDGKKFFSTHVFAHQQFINWDSSKVPQGNYVITLMVNDINQDSIQVSIVKK